MRLASNVSLPVWFLTVSVLTACTWIVPPSGTAPATAPAVSAEQMDHPVAPAGCPVTAPNGRTPSGEFSSPAQHHGNDAVVTVLWPNGVVVIESSMVLADGTLAMKWPWWREAPGRLAVEGHRLDAPSPSLRSSIPDGYGDNGFQASGIFFPSEGCWEVTGRVGQESLTFVTWVQRS